MLEPAIARTSPAAPPSAAFADGLGERYYTLVRDTPLEVLTLREELAAVSSFEFALRERASRLAGFHPPCFSRVLGIERLDDGMSTLGIVSEHVTGARLSDILLVADQELLPLEFDAALCLIRQLVAAAALLHETVRDVSHGALAPERIVVTPDGRLVIVEHVLGAALEQLRFSHQRYWKELRIALPRTAGAPRFDRRTDVTQIGAVALALTFGRPLGDDEYPSRIGDMAATARAMTATGGAEELPDAFRTWLLRALQLDSRNSYASAIDAAAELESVLAYRAPDTEAAALHSFLVRYQAQLSGVDVAPARAAHGSTPAVLTAAQPAAPMPRVPPAGNSVAAGITTAARATAPAGVTAPASVTTAGNQPVPVSSAAHASSAVPAEPDPLPVPPPSAPERSGEYTRAPRPEDFFLPHQQRAHRPYMFMRVARPRRRLLMAVGLVAMISAGVLAMRQYLLPPAVAEVTGALAVSTNPAGALIVIDGQERGVTPINLSLAPGDHLLEVVANGERRSIPVTITPGGQVSQFLELPNSPRGVGRLLVRTEPSAARVTVDGHAFGTSPLTVDNLTPGPHTVVLESELGSVTHEVTIEAGATASLVVPLAAPQRATASLVVPQGAPVSGWITVSAPSDVQVFENGRLLGSSRSDRIMVAAGRHQLEIVNDLLGYKTTRIVQVAAGKVSSIRLDWPKESIAINAIPWAEVWIGRERIGETPIGSFTVPIGSHEVVFRHPELGERRVNVLVKAGAPARVSVDLRR